MTPKDKQTLAKLALKYQNTKIGKRIAKYLLKQAALPPKGKLLATSGTIEGIKKMIGKFYYSNNIELKEIAPNVWDVYNGEKFVSGTIVVKRGKRFCFEARN